MANAILNATKYGVELLKNATPYSESLANVSGDVDVSNYLRHCRKYPSSAMGILGLAFYDIAMDGKGLRFERETIGRDSSRILLLTDIVDGVIDRSQTTLEEKMRFVNRVKSNMLGEMISFSDSVEENAAYALAGAINNPKFSKAQKNKIDVVFSNIISAIGNQFVEKNPDELIRIAKQIGAGCTDSVAVLTEISKDQDFPEMREAARKFGEYCELLDHAYEINEDLREGANTYPTAVISREGDSKATRQRVIKEMNSLARQSFEEGKAQLQTQNQKAIYDSIKLLVDFKYKVLERLK